MADFEDKIARFTDRDVAVVAASTETFGEATETVEKSGVSYPVGYGLDPEEFASRYGAYYADDDEEPYLHATGFLVDPGGVVDIVVYSSGAIGRFTADDAMQILEYRLKPEE